MVTPTRAKNVTLKLYECVKESFTATASQTDFTVAQTPLLDTVADANNKPYHRVYANGVKIVPTSITASTKVYVVAAQPVGTIVEIVYPKTAKSDMRIQQGLDYSSEAKTDEWEELNSTVTTTDLISRKGTGSVKLLRNNKAELALIEGYADAATWCLLALQDSKSDLTKAERTILAEVQWLGTKGGVSVGGKHEETYNFSFKTPIETMAIT